MKRLIIIGFFIIYCTLNLFAEKYYVDRMNGSNTNTGTKPEDAWKTVEKVNEFIFQPEDVIHFRAGQVWRESLRCQSVRRNKHGTYTSYGEGAKPLFLGSINVCLEHFWINKGNNIWCVASEFFSTGVPHNYRDIGNIILTEKDEVEKKAAWKRWSLEELSQQGDFYHNT